MYTLKDSLMQENRDIMTLRNKVYIVTPCMLQSEKEEAITWTRKKEIISTKTGRQGVNSD